MGSRRHPWRQRPKLRLHRARCLCLVRRQLQTTRRTIGKPSPWSPRHQSRPRLHPPRRLHQQRHPPSQIHPKHSPPRRLRRHRRREPCRRRPLLRPWKARKTPGKRQPSRTLRRHLHQSSPKRQWSSPNRLRTRRNPTRRARNHPAHHGRVKAPSHAQLRAYRHERVNLPRQVAPASRCSSPQPPSLAASGSFCTRPASLQWLNPRSLRNPQNDWLPARNRPNQRPQQPLLLQRSNPRQAPARPPRTFLLHNPPLLPRGSSW